MIENEEVINMIYPNIKFYVSIIWRLQKLCVNLQSQIINIKPISSLLLY